MEQVNLIVEEFKQAIKEIEDNPHMYLEISKRIFTFYKDVVEDFLLNQTEVIDISPIHIHANKFLELCQKASTK